MPRLEKKDYEPLVDDIVNGYFNSGVSLTDGVYKKAEELGLAPDQIKQLVWQANTKTHLDLFEKKAEDKVIEFPLADVDKVMAKLYAEPSPVKEAAAVNDALDFAQEVDFNPQVKIAETVTEIPEPTKSKSNQIMFVRKLASELESVVLQKLSEYQEVIFDGRAELRKLAEYKYSPSDLQQVSHDATSYYGQGVIPVLRDLKLYNDKVTHLKQASLPDTEDHVFKMVTKAKDVFDDAVKYAKAFQKVKGQYREYL